MVSGCQVPSHSYKLEIMIAARIAAQAYLYKEILQLDKCSLEELLPGAQAWNPDLLQHQVSNIVGCHFHPEFALSTSATLATASHPQMVS